MREAGRRGYWSLVSSTVHSSWQWGSSWGHQPHTTHWSRCWHTLRYIRFKMMIGDEWLETWDLIIMNTLRFEANNAGNHGKYTTLIVQMTISCKNPFYIVILFGIQKYFIIINISRFDWFRVLSRVCWCSWSLEHWLLLSSPQWEQLWYPLLWSTLS